MGRYNHTAVWTGGTMIVWGGESGPASDTQFERRRDLQSDDQQWTATGTTTTGAPEARYYHTAVWTGTTMIVWGGVDVLSGRTSSLNDGGVYQSGGQ